MIVPRWLKVTHRRATVLVALVGLAAKCLLDILQLLVYLPGQLMASPGNTLPAIQRWFWYDFVGANGTTLEGLLFHWNRD